MISKGKRSAIGVFAAIPGCSPGLGRALKAFLLERQIAGATLATIQTYKTQLEPFGAWCNRSGIDLPELSVDILRSYLASRQQLSQSALYEAARRLKTFFSWCGKESICEDFGAQIRIPKQPVKVIVALSVAQVRALLAVGRGESFIGRRNEALLRLLIDSGLRITEALTLKMSDLNLEAGRALVQGKGQKQRFVAFGPRTTKALVQYVRARERLSTTADELFLSINGQPMKRRHIQQHLKRLAHRAGIVGVRVSPHTLRHTFATWYLRNGGDVFSLQRLLGHASLAMTQRYLYLTDGDVSATHEKFSPGNLV